MNGEFWLQVTSGQGPNECALAACKLVKAILREAKAHGLRAELCEAVEGDNAGTLLSALISIEGEGAAAFAQSWKGSIKWICESPFRPSHKRKNWFVGVNVIEAAGDAEPILLRGEVAFDTMRASGPGGQHVNKTESAVRATHLPTGLVTVSRSERSQHRNKKLALAQLAALLADQQSQKQADRRESQWQNHTDLERGNPVRVFMGMAFKEKKHG